MTNLRDKINVIETKLSDFQQEEEDLKSAIDEAKEVLKEITGDLEDATTPKSIEDADIDDDDDDAFVVMPLSWMTTW